jgi:exosortase H (IPTLxxWG-CTERM-specific)
MNRGKNRARKSDVPSLTAEWRDWYAGKALVLKFGGKFGALIILLYVLLALPFFDHLLYAYLEANAWLCHLVLNALGQHTQLSGVVIQSPRFSVAVERGCDAVEPTWLVLAAIVAFPARWIRKLEGIAAAVVILQVLNLVRIMTLFWIGFHWPGIFDTVHVEIWPAFFILVAIVFFLGWKDWATNRVDANART